MSESQRPPKAHSVDRPAALVDKTILSAQNPVMSDFRDLLSAKGIRKQGYFIVAGERAVRETLERYPALARNLLLCADRHVPQGQVATHPASGPSAWVDLVRHARELTTGNEPRFSVIALGRTLFDELDPSGTHVPLLVAKTPAVAEADLAAKPQGLEILCALGDPSNVGALLRTAAAFGASRIVLLKECATPFHPKAVRAASAATLMTPLAKGPSIRELPALIESGEIEGPILALDMIGESLNQFTWPKDARLLLGEEGQGVPSSQGFKFISVPMQIGVESLNATVAASVALYSYRLGRPLGS